MIDQGAVYIYKFPEDRDFFGLALGVHMHGGALRFLDTNRGHEIPGEVVAETEKGFTFRSTGYAEGDWEFRILTIEAFRRKYHQIVVNGEVMAAAIKTTADLHYWYRREFGI